MSAATASVSAWPPPDWERRFRARRVGLPEWALQAPDRAVVVASVAGTLEVHSWTPSTRSLVQATRRTNGTTDATIDPHGTWLWWFDDSDGDEFGRWRRQPFGSPPNSRAEAPIPLPDAYDAGLLLAEDGTVVVGRSGDFGTQVHALYIGPGAAGTTPRLLYAHSEAAEAAALSWDGNLVALEHSERGDSRHPALRVLRVDTGSALSELDDGPGRGLFALDFAPRPGDTRLLVRHERGDVAGLLIWDVATSTVQTLDLGLPGEVADAHWYPDGRSLLVAVDHEARTLTYRYDLADRSVHQVGSATGTVSGATARPDGEVWLARSSAAEPRDVIEASTGTTLITLGENRVPGSVSVEDVWADGPAGRVHALLRRPVNTVEPLPVVVEVHGGPTWHESDSFSPYAAAWVDHGYAVLSVNYRGSTGYGNAWRDALEGRVGHTELEDIAAVHEALAQAGVVDRERSILAGASWGGYLTLLGLGTQPERWSLGVASVPVADYVTAYADEMDALQAFDRSLFGGSPRQVPQAYTDSSPITYVGQVRSPVLILAGTNDPRCPFKQIQNYVDMLRSHGGEVELYTYDAGHGSAVDDERVRQMRAELEFVVRHVPA
ncbi:S9 family peptidase [Ruania alba]|uniref:Dipeptidyl aminopeptidase/acylaminoacyl peptidase n=1 Tax=Ruania alba TaxID=648782 RepID=A0A1H5MN77_9MICO|nr:prolyl oligopeptidase family serine peptidase [Ruania alba]SEE90663.1 Dipeptidyl aminopeptidase/acylaminoacyl peptidase [Ruania alba]